MLVRSVFCSGGAALLLLLPISACSEDYTGGGRRFELPTTSTPDAQDAAMDSGLDAGSELLGEDDGPEAGQGGDVYSL